MTEPTQPRKKRMIKVGAITYAQLILRMLEGTYNCKELAELTGLHYVTVLQYTRELRRAGAAHISSWDKDSRGMDTIKVYKIGHGKDAKRDVMTRDEIAARYRAKKRNLEVMRMMAA